MAILFILVVAQTMPMDKIHAITYAYYRLNRIQQISIICAATVPCRSPLPFAISS